MLKGVIQRLHLTNLVQVGCTVLLAGLVLYPLFWLFMGSFQSDPRSFSFTFKAYTNILALPFLGEIIYNTAAMAVGAPNRTVPLNSVTNHLTKVVFPVPAPPVTNILFILITFRRHFLVC